MPSWLGNRLLLSLPSNKLWGANLAIKPGCNTQPASSPRHIWVPPLNPTYPFPIMAESRMRIEIRACAKILRRLCVGIDEYNPILNCSSSMVFLDSKNPFHVFWMRIKIGIS